MDNLDEVFPYCRSCGQRVDGRLHAEPYGVLDLETDRWTRHAWRPFPTARERQQEREDNAARMAAYEKASLDALRVALAQN